MTKKTQTLSLVLSCLCLAALTGTLRQNLNGAALAQVDELLTRAVVASTPIPAMNGNLFFLNSKSDRSPALERKALRLQKRLKDLDRGSFTIPELSDALQERGRLLRHSLTIFINSEDGTAFEPWVISLQAHPLWIQPLQTFGSFTFVLDPNFIETELETQGIPGLPSPTQSVISALTVDGKVERVSADTVAKSGFVYDSKDLISQIEAAFEEETPSIVLKVKETPGAIVNATGQDLGPLQFIASGRSDFAGSGNGRINNVRKGLNERLHNVLIPPGGTFSFNDSLGPVTASRGWQEALGIFNGSELRMITGGGICQVATTIYRAAINAGMPIVARKNHSLYVTYYEKFGVGIDATVFQGAQDFKFKNDTASYMLVQSYTDGFDARVMLYGAPDGRKVALEGPFLSTNSPMNFMDTRALRPNEIGWLQHITHSDGRVESLKIVSRYNSVPKRLLTEYAAIPAETAHAAAKTPVN